MTALVCKNFYSFSVYVYLLRPYRSLVAVVYVLLYSFFKVTRSRSYVIAVSMFIGFSERLILLRSPFFCLLELYVGADACCVFMSYVLRWLCVTLARRPYVDRRCGVIRERTLCRVVCSE